MKRVFSVPRIHCSGCVATVEGTLRGVPGVTAVVGDALKKTVEVVFDSSQVTEDRLRQALANVGYPAAS